MGKRFLALIGLLLVSACATSDAAQNEDHATCTGWGVPAGTEAYAQCRTALVNDRREARSAQLMKIGTALQAAGGAISDTPVRATTPAAPPVTQLCFSRGEQVSGMNKICYYNCMGSTAAITQSAVSLCPMSITR